VSDCREIAPVHGHEGDLPGVLICTIPAGHSGDLHFDSEDNIWWKKEGQ
jgi:hypothetical protein